MVRNTSAPRSLPYVDPASIDKFAIFRVIGHKPDEWQRLAHHAVSKFYYVLLACGVRVGKTYFSVHEVVAQAVTPSKHSVPPSEENPRGEWVGSRIWIVAPTYDLADRVFLPVLRILRKHFPQFVEGFSERDGVIHLVGGGIIQRKTAENPDALVGEELDLLVLEECARIGEEEKEMAAARLLTRRGRMIAISSPTSVKWFMRDFKLGQGNGFHYEFEGEPIEGAKYAGRTVRFVKNDAVDDPDARDYFSVRIPTHANPRLDVNDLAREERKKPERLFRQDFLAEFVGDTGLVFQNPENFCVPRDVGERKDAEPGRLYALAWDPARTTDWSVVSVWDYREQRQVFLDRFRGPWAYQYQRVIDLCYRFRQPHVIIDATGKGDAVHENLTVLNRQAGSGLPEYRKRFPQGAFARNIEAVTTYTNAEKRLLVESLATALEQGDAKLLDYPEQLHELRLFEFIESETTKAVRYTAPRGYHDDIVMADALGWRAVSKPMGAPSFILG